MLQGCTTDVTDAYKKVNTCIAEKMLTKRPI